MKYLDIMFNLEKGGKYSRIEPFLEGMYHNMRYGTMGESLGEASASPDEGVMAGDKLLYHRRVVLPQFGSEPVQTGTKPQK